MYYPIFTSFIIGTIITHEFLRQYYPEEYKIYAFVVGYNSLYLFSKFQIFFNKFYKTIEIHVIPFYDEYSKKIYPFLEEIGLKEKQIRKDIKLVKNGMTTKFFKKDELEFLKRLKPHFDGTFDIIVYTDYDNVAENGKTNKVIYSEIPENLEYNVANTSFILSEIFIDNSDAQCSYKIDFSSEKYNYFVVGNKFCRHFITYFLRKHYNHIYKDHLKQLMEHDYVLKIIDNNVNMLDLCKMKVLKINGEDCLVEDFKEKEYRVYESDLYPKFRVEGVINALEESNKEESEKLSESVKMSESNMDDSYVKL